MAQLDIPIAPRQLTINLAKPSFRRGPGSWERTLDPASVGLEHVVHSVVDIRTPLVINVIGRICPDHQAFVEVEVTRIPRNFTAVSRRLAPILRSPPRARAGEIEIPNSPYR